MVRCSLAGTCRRSSKVSSHGAGFKMWVDRSSFMDEDYYRFTIEHSLQEDGAHIANIESLICLKSKAFFDLSLRKAKGESVDSKHIFCRTAS